MSIRKNPNLCERPYCREPWTHQVNGYETHWKRSWTLRVCQQHVEPYLPRPGKVISASTPISIVSRPTPVDLQKSNVKL